MLKKTLFILLLAVSFCVSAGPRDYRDYRGYKSYPKHYNYNQHNQYRDRAHHNYRSYRNYSNQRDNHRYNRDASFQYRYHLNNYRPVYKGDYRSANRYRAYDYRGGRPSHLR
ncbi:hypothetical protein [Limnobaculum parvum]|uniref:DUF2502 domain-containing protein n=1 Tax=Limnobaculum parvum TaxID=2172103 RepID=A0A2Y9TWK2_9GAMM|nr:hypothetical protein [Limnobaculum parvum]AWH88006.1 hypothetical protein HYN51_05195 [Limnobaculum parvum]